MNGKELLIDGIEKIGLEISVEQANQFMKYYEMLIETNKVMNLTAITELDEVIIKHFIDSLLVAKKINVNNFDSLIDVGTGAGFPGIPIKIMFPEIRVVLLDSLNKRLKFLNNVIDELGLKNITTVHGRAEDIAHMDEYREKFSLCVSRAVANLSTLSEYCIPFIKKGGMFISYKSISSEEELSDSKNAQNKLCCKLKKNISFELPDTDMRRNFLLFEKFDNTSSKYPRNNGIPRKKPL